MKKGDIIKEIQLQEAKSFKELKENEYLFGDCALTKTSRTKFVTLNTLMESLGIKADFNLDQNKEAMAFMDLNHQKQSAADENH